MRTIFINLFRFNELDNKPRSLARTALLDDRDFVINTNEFVDVRAGSYLHKVVPSEIVEALKIFTCAVGEPSYPLDVLPTKGDGRSRPPFEPRTAQKRTAGTSPRVYAWGM